MTVTEPITEGEVRVLIYRAHAHKVCYPSGGHARYAAMTTQATDGRPLRAYSCPFGQIFGEHWHIGHPPSLAHIEQIAAAIRWVTEHGAPTEP